MLRRQFAKFLTLPAFAWLSLKVTGCGSVSASSELLDEGELPDTIKIWSYYVPLTNYDGIIEDFEDRDPRDLKIIFDEVTARTSRISGRRNDGTSNRASLDVAALRDGEEDFQRVTFWHDDQDPDGDTGHTLHLFKRYLETLESGEKLFVATGMIQGHFHVVMLDPSDP